MSTGDVINFLVAMAIGGLVGLEREIYQQRERRDFAGIRTYIVVAFLGAISSYLLQKGDWPVLTYFILGGIILLLVTSYWHSASRGSIGMTTELSVLLVYVLSGVAMIDKYREMAVIFGALLVLVLSGKKMLHNFAKKTRDVEWYNTLIFIFMAFVILPLLPNRDFDFLGIAAAFNPYNIWLMVVLVSGISFVGYFLTKVVGGISGIGVTGILGGIVSSTAVTESMAVDSKQRPKLTSAYAFATVAASVVLGVRILGEVLAVNSSLLTLEALPVLLVSVVGLIMSLQWVGSADEKDGEGDIHIVSPLALKPALTFGLIYFLAVLFTRYVVSVHLGSYSFLLIGIVSGVACVDVVALSMASLFGQGVVSSGVAWMAILAAVVSNTIFKIVIARIFGSKPFFHKVALALTVMAVAGIIILALNLF